MGIHQTGIMYTCAYGKFGIQIQDVYADSGCETSDLTAYHAIATPTHNTCYTDIFMLIFGLIHDSAFSIELCLPFFQPQVVIALVR